MSSQKLSFEENSKKVKEVQKFSKDRKSLSRTNNNSRAQLLDSEISVVERIENSISLSKNISPKALKEISTNVKPNVCSCNNTRSKTNRSRSSDRRENKSISMVKKSNNSSSRNALHTTSNKSNVFSPVKQFRKDQVPKFQNIKDKTHYYNTLVYVRINQSSFSRTRGPASFSKEKRKFNITYNKKNIGPVKYFVKMAEHSTDSSSLSKDNRKTISLNQNTLEKINLNSYEAKDFIKSRF